MAISYSSIIIYTSEETKYHNKSLSMAVVDYIHQLHIAARCMVTNGIAGCYENGEITSQRLEILSYNMPVKIEIILPTSLLEQVLPQLEEMVSDGIVLVQQMELKLHRIKNSLLPRHLKVRDVMTPSPQSVSITTPVKDLVHLLLTSDFNCIPVVDSAGCPVGIITQGDLIKRAGIPVRPGLLHEFEQTQVDDFLKSFTDKTAGEVMTQPVITISKDAELVSAVNQMLVKKLKRLPVKDAKGQLAGMLSRYDIFKIISREAAAWTPADETHITLDNVHFVRDVMQRDTQTVSPTTPASEIVCIINNNNIQRVAVVDEGKKLLGIISDRDVFPLLSEKHQSLWQQLLHRHSQEKINITQDMPAEEIMLHPVITIQEDDILVDAIKVMVDKGLKRLPVVDADGIFKGMLTRDALLRIGME